MDPKHNRIKVMLGDKQRIIDKHVLVEVFKISHIGESKVDHAKMSNAKHLQHQWRVGCEKDEVRVC